MVREKNTNIATERFTNKRRRYLSSPRNYARAAILSSIAFSGWSFSDVLLKLVRREGVPQGEILLISGISGMAVIFLISALRGTLPRLHPQRWGGLLTIGLCQLASFIFWMMALPRLPLTTMYVVTFLTPMTVACLAALILKERIGWKRAVAIATGFVGVVIAVNPENLIQHGVAWLPYLALIGSMAGTAVQMLLLRVLAGRENNECTAFYPRSIIAVAGLASCVASGFSAMSLWAFLSICASGALGGIGWALMAQAYKDAPAAAVAPFQYSQMITGALLGYLIWSDVPNAYLLCGTAIIIASGLYLVRHERRVSRMMVRAE